MKWIIFFVLLVAIFVSPHQMGWAQKKDSSVCAAKYLQLRDCLVSHGQYEVQFTEKKFIVNNGVWRHIYDQPVVAEESLWQSVAIRKLGSRYLLEQLVWDQPKGEANLQDLHWYVWELDEAKAHQRIHEVVQKRSVSKDESGRAKYTLDPPILYGVKHNAKKDRHIYWRAGDKKGQF